jgi:Tfp pilus assembly protein PilO
MNASIQRTLWVNVAWTSALAILVLGLVIGSLFRIHTARDVAKSLSESVLKEQHSVSQLPDIDEHRVELAQADGLLGEWSECLDSEASRISALSSAARATGVTCVSLGSFQPGIRDNGHVLTSSHKLVAVGGYQQLARFVDAVYAVRGMVAVNEFELEPDGGREQGVLRVSMTVEWNASGPGPKGAELAE